MIKYWDKRKFCTSTAIVGCDECRKINIIKNIDCDMIDGDDIGPEDRLIIPGYAYYNADEVDKLIKEILDALPQGICCGSCDKIKMNKEKTNNSINPKIDFYCSLDGKNMTAEILYSSCENYEPRNLRESAYKKR